jgi:hypothetical protein
MQFLEKAINNSKFKKAYKVEHLKYENNINNFTSGIRLYILIKENILNNIYYIPTKEVNLIN